MVVSVCDVAYSYLRFSGKRQERGDSIRRQRSATRRWAKRMKIPLDESLSIDKGLSAFTGKNVDIGSLGAFLKLVDEGIVKPGSYLVVENLDRISRDEVQDALRLILNLLGAGIRIVQLSPVEKVFDNKSSGDDLMWMIAELSRANSESRLKSDRLLQRRRRERKAMHKGRKIRQRLPGWVRREKGQLVPVPERAAVVCRVFEMVLAGLSVGHIAERLNSEQVPTFSGRGMWAKGYLRQLIGDGRVHGRHQPRGPGREPDGEAIEDYYPVVVESKTVLAAQREIATRRSAGRKPQGDFVNVFRGLCYDAGTSHPLSMVSQHAQRYGHRYLIVARTIPYDGRRTMHRLDVVERAVCSGLREVKVEDVIGTNRGDERRSLDAAEGDLRELLASQKVIIDRLATKHSETLLAAADAIDEKIADARRRVALSKMAMATPLSASWEQAKTLTTAVQGDNAESRRRFYSALKAITEGIYLLGVDVGTTRLTVVQIHFAGGRIRDYIVAFRKWVVREGKEKQGADWGVWSLAHEPGEGERDLRQPSQVDRIKRHLASIDVDALSLEPYGD